MGGVTKIMVVLMVVVAVADTARPTRLTAAQCHKEKVLAVNACGSSLLRGELPGSQCCHRVRVTHSACICPEITPAVMNMIGDVKRAIRLIETCHRTVPHHFKCGSVTTP